MIRSVDEKMDEARAFFTHRSELAKNLDERAIYEHLADMAASIQETQRMLDYLKTRVEEIQHATGLHLVGTRGQPGSP